MTGLPLEGTSVLVTRPSHQAESLCLLIEKNGGRALRFPTLEIQGLPSETSATFSLGLLSNSQFIIFTSANAVNFALALIGGKIRIFAKASIAAIGKATASALNKADIPVHVLPENGYNSEALLANPQLRDVRDKTILIVKGQGGREELAAVLGERGAKVHTWDVYRRVIPPLYDDVKLQTLIREKNPVIVATSYEALENLLSMSMIVAKDLLMAIPLVVISRRIADLAVKLGFSRIGVTDDPSDRAIINTTIAIIKEGQRG